MASSQFVDTPGLRIHHRQAGSSGEPVLFLHGFPQTSYQWRHQMVVLSAAGYSCFAPDNRGFGGTDKPDVRISRGLLARDVVRYLDAMGIESAHVVAHDWGGIIAAKVVADHPERVRSMALLDTLLTTWPPRAVHGWWFKAEGLPEEFFAHHHRAFIEVMFGGRPPTDLPAAPASPWGAAGSSPGIPAESRGRPAWIDDEALDHYRDAFADPAAWAAAIQYYRYGLPFHLVSEAADGIESFRLLTERQVGEMWLNPGGLSAHPDHALEHDVGPEDRTASFDGPALWLYGTPPPRPPRVDAPVRAERAPAPPTPFVAQFARIFPQVRSQGLVAGHFLAEEVPDQVNEALLAHLAAATKAGARGGGRS